MNTSELLQYVGKKGLATRGELTFPAIVVDTRVRFGSLEFLVTPIGGDGAAWVSRRFVRLEGEEL